MMPYLVVHAEAESDATLPIERAALAQAGAELRCAASTEPEEILRVARDADVLLTEVAPITRAMLEGMPRCRAVICYAIGVDHVDLRAATEQGILVVNMPGFCLEEVANHTLLFVLACRAASRSWSEPHAGDGGPTAGH